MGVPAVLTSVAFVVIAVVWALLERVDGLERGVPHLALETVIVLAACFALVWRLNAPVPVATITIVVVAFAPGAGGAALLAIFSLAVHRHPRRAVPFGAAFVIMSSLKVLGSAAVTLTDALGQLGVAVLLSALAIVGGSMVHNRRQLIRSLIELAASAESIERERVGRVRMAERSLLAGEMHDVLAHRMSLVAIHAGALEYAENLPPEETRRAAGVVRAGVHQMLEELRGVIDTLRDDSVDSVGLGPAPTLLGVAVLFEESEGAGYPVEAVVDLDEVIGSLPGQIDRAAYRVVQEGLTNARKHGGGGTICVTIIGREAAGVTVRVSQPLRRPAGRGAVELPGSASGLVGLVERAVLVGGSVRYGAERDDFVLTARFPLQTHA